MRIDRISVIPGTKMTIIRKAEGHKNGFFYVREKKSRFRVNYVKEKPGPYVAVQIFKLSFGYAWGW